VAQPVKAVTFDFWNTIARERPGTAMTEMRQQAVIAACEACGVEVEAELLVASLEEAVTSYHRSWSAGTHFHPSEGAEMLVRALGLEGAAREMVAEAFLTAGRGAKLELAPEIRPCLEALSARGIKLGIVCDVGFTGGELLRDFLDREGLLGYFGHPRRAAWRGGPRRRPAPHRYRRRQGGRDGHRALSRTARRPRRGGRGGGRFRH